VIFGCWVIHIATKVARRREQTILHLRLILASSKGRQRALVWLIKLSLHLDFCHRLHAPLRLAWLDSSRLIKVFLGVRGTELARRRRFVD